MGSFEGKQAEEDVHHFLVAAAEDELDETLLDSDNQVLGLFDRLLLLCSPFAALQLYLDHYLNSTSESVQCLH